MCKKNSIFDGYIENGKIIWKEPSIYLIIIFRLLKKKTWVITILKPILIPLYFFLSLLLGINIPRTTKIGRGLRIHHYSDIVLNSQTIIGDFCTIRNGVTIGNKDEYSGCPKIGNKCNIGAGAKILGEITIGDNVTIGANSVVVKDVPDNCVVVGIPAKIIKIKK